ncbi:MAG: hypothetical protein CMF69_06660 [Magnetovibrio sp.]|nr:hypothetical protein [Magnetovibrio sp.]
MLNTRVAGKGGNLCNPMAEHSCAGKGFYAALIFQTKHPFSLSVSSKHHANSEVARLLNKINHRTIGWFDYPNFSGYIETYNNDID